MLEKNDTINALTASDKIVIPMETDYLALRGASILINTTVKKVKASEKNPYQEIEIETFADMRKIENVLVITGW